MNRKLRLRSRFARLVGATVIAAALAAPAAADETSCSPYTPLIHGQEDLVYIWTLGVKGIGDGSDKLVTIDVNPASKTYGKVIHKLSIGGRGEIHHIGLSDDRRYLWGGALDSNKIFVFDIGSDPAKPKLVKTIKNFVQKTGFVGPHSFIALPGRMLITPLSNSKDHGGETGIAIYNNKGDYVTHQSMPKGEAPNWAGKGDGYSYDAGINPAKNVFLTTSFTGWNNYMMDLGKLIKDGEAMKHFGNTSVMWDLKSMKPIKVFETPGAPLEVRWSLNKGDNWALTTSALTSKMWMYKQDSKGEWQVKEVATIGDPAKIPLPVDISMTANGKGLWVATFMDGTVRYFDLSDHGNVREVYQKKVGSQVNMVSQSLDGKRVYVTTSLLGNWDKKGADDEQFLKIYDWDGKELTQKVYIDFYKEKLGRAHHMKFQLRDLKQLKPLETAAGDLQLMAKVD